MLTVITGPPCSGKSSHVREHAGPGDVIVDFDRIARALGSPDEHDHPSAVVDVARSVWRGAVEGAIACHLAGGRAWVVDAKLPPNRWNLYHLAGAEFVRLSAPAAELHRRAAADGRPRWCHDLIDGWPVLDASH